MSAAVIVSIYEKWTSLGSMKEIKKENNSKKVYVIF